jgi:NAD(P)-dependent dehydrogenase (short-subunit alcohol dehydrogenase family)
VIRSSSSLARRKASARPPRAAAAAGYRLVLAARRRGGLDALAAELGGPDRALAVPCDISDWDQLQELVSRGQDAFGRLDVAFANAAIVVPTSFTGGGGAPPSEWAEMVRVNVLGTALTARAVLPALAMIPGHLVIIGRWPAGSSGPAACIPPPNGGSARWPRQSGRNAWVPGSGSR